MAGHPPGGLKSLNPAPASQRVEMLSGQNIERPMMISFTHQHGFAWPSFPGLLVCWTVTAFPALADGKDFVAPFSGNPRVVSGSGHLGADILSLFEDGYLVIRTQRNKEYPRSPEELISDASDLKAEMVVVNEGTPNQFGTLRLDVSAPGTTLGMTPEGFRPYDATRLKILNDFAPHQRAFFRQEVAFLARSKGIDLGLAYRGLLKSEARSTGWKNGVVIQAVRKGSVAFEAGLERGDLIISVGDTNIDNISRAAEAFREARGHEVSLKVMRKNELLPPIKLRVLDQDGPPPGNLPIPDGPPQAR